MSEIGERTGEWREAAVSVRKELTDAELRDPVGTPAMVSLVSAIWRPLLNGYTKEYDRVEVTGQLLLGELSLSAQDALVVSIDGVIGNGFTLDNLTVIRGKQLLTISEHSSSLTFALLSERRSVPARTDFTALFLGPAVSDIREPILFAAKNEGINAVALTDLLTPGTLASLTVQDAITRADCVIAEVSDAHSNVLFEIGVALGMRKPIFLATTLLEGGLPAALAGYVYMVFDPNAPHRLHFAVRDWIRSLRQRRRGPER